MNPSLYDYYYSSHNIEGVQDPFYEVIHIDENSEIGWYQLEEIAPLFPKGWFELTSLSIDDKIQFSYDYWMSVFPYDPLVESIFAHFFHRLEGIYFFLTKTMPEEPFKPEMVYSMQEGAFFRALPPLPLNEKSSLPVKLPHDYLLFLRIHNGFAKGSDTGIFPLLQMEEMTQKWLYTMHREQKEVFALNEGINPSHLYPFYQSYGKNDFQCFYSDWSPTGEMGNIFYSGSDNTISSYKNHKEGLSFPTFFEWLTFYIE